MTNYLLDTNAVSEWMKPRPDPGLVRWLDVADEDRLYLSVVTVGEIQQGVERLPESAKRERLAEWLSNELLDRFSGRLLPVDIAVARAWGRIRARAESAGRGVGAVDALIAATAESNGLEVVTRNVADFESTGVTVVDPWER